MNKISLSDTQRRTSACFEIYEKYSWLLNSYVLDFFTENHWEKLQPSWQSFFKDVNAIEIAELLDYEYPMQRKVYPLSLLSLKTILTSLSLPRKISDVNIDSPFFVKDDKLLKLFWKNVKAKKRHEISVMSKICYNSALETNCFHIIDIGSGLGHLSRMLNYGYGFKVCTIEAQEELSKQANYLDHEFEHILERKYKNFLRYNRTIHVNKRINANITAEEFLKIIANAFKVDDVNFKFGIVGLHPCGDLAATLLKLFKECQNSCFINLVGCCYMKLTTLPGDPSQGFPLSRFCRNNQYNLSYHSREIACHAIENYIEKLRKDECWRLKIHTYRAVLEKIITRKRPDCHHCALNNVKYTQDLTFENYCKKATKKLKIDFSGDKLQTGEIEALLMQWKEVVVFYSLRLLFAPLIESIILLDRFMYILETGSSGDILSVFDAKISPRTHVLTAKKT